MLGYKLHHLLMPLTSKELFETMFRSPITNHHYLASFTTPFPPEDYRLTAIACNYWLWADLIRIDDRVLTVAARVIYTLVAGRE
jgi:hypothetical protein